MSEFELLRNITIGQYMPTGSIVHRLDPRAKLLSTLCLAAAFSSLRSILVNALLILLLLLIAKGARIPIRYILRGLLPGIGALLFIFVLQLFFQGWREPSGQVYFEWEFIRITRYSLYVIVLGVLRVVAFLFLISLLTLTTSSSHLMHGIETLLAPLRRIGFPVHEVALVNMIALRFVPTLAEELERIMKAQASRCGEIGGRNIWRPDKAARTRLPLIIPLFLSALRRAEDLIVAMEARCYGSGTNRTKFVQLKGGWLDGVVVVGIIGICLLAWLTPWPSIHRLLPGM